MDVASQASTDIPRLLNGHLGLFVNKTAANTGIFKRLWDQGSLLNPVMGMRWDPMKPRLTIGALDPEDYIGEINWVPLEDRYTATGGIYQTNEFHIDGVKGFNGSLLPFPENPTAILHACQSPFIFSAQASSHQPSQSLELSRSLPITPMR